MRIDNPSISGSLSFIGGNNSISATSVNLTGSFSGSVVGTFEGAFSSTATANISGAFDSVSSSLASRIASQESFSSSLDNTFATDAQVSTAVSSLNAATSSYLQNTTDTLTGDLTVTGTLTAQDLHVQEVTSSIVYSSGSNIFGTDSSNSQILYGNVGIGTAYPSSSLHIYDNTASRLTVGQYGAPHYTQSGMAYQVIRATTDNAARALLELHSGNQGTKANVQAVGANNTVYFGSLTNSNASYGNDVEAFYFNTAGNVGLGTTNNTHKLVVKGTSAALTSDSDMRFYVDRSAATEVGSIIFTTGGASVSNGWAEIGQTDANGDLYFKANASAASYDTRMVIKGSNGRVGIGTTSPAGDLEISGSGNSNRTITFNPSFNDDISISSMGVDASGWNAVTIGKANSENNSAVFRFKYVGAGSSSNYLGLGFYNNDDKLVITPAGSIGIGTTSPERNLHVFKGESGGATSNSDSSLVLENSSNTYLQFLTPTTTESGILFGDIDNDAGAITYNHNFNEFNFRTAGVSDRMTIDSSGNVGIGESNPASDLVVRSDSAGGRGGEITILNYATNTVGNEAALNFGLESSTYNADSGNAQIKATVASATAATDMMFSTWNGSSFGERLRIESSGNMGFNTSVTTVGGSGTQTSTATPKRILFNNDYSNGYTDGSLKLYLFNLGATRHGFTSGPNYDLQYHSSGHSTQAAHTFYTNNNFVMRIGTGDTTNVGINTTNPVGLLNIHYTENDDDKRLRISGGSGNYKDVQWKDTTSGEMWIWSHRTDALGNAFEAWYYNGTSYNSTSTLSLRPNGNVGLGTETSKAQLHINSGGSYNNTDNNNRLFIEYSAGSPYILFSSPDERDQGIHFHNTTDNSFVGRIAYQHRSAGDKLWFRIGTSSGNGQFLFDSDGLKFNGDTAAANGLDDYEEGDWTPVLSWNSGGDYTMDTGTTIGKYTKIGNLVYVTCTVKWTAAPANTSGNLVVKGLPFTIGGIRNAGSISASAGGLSFTSSSYTQWTITGDPSRTDFYIIQQGGSGGYSHTPTVASSGIIYSISLTYRI